MRADADPIVTAAHRLPAVAASFAPYPEGTDERLRAALAARGVEQLYTHQAEAFEHVLAGRNVVTITPTASGKTLCYNAPVLNAILQDPSTRALYLFPTKALAQDQLAELHALSELVTRDPDVEIGVFTYDGDTPSDARRAIRGKAHVVLSNPDMVHSGILPHHPRWAKLFENLRFVIIDELHAYRGVFGSHLANILRRLQRICRHYGSDPVFICSSATIANPRELAEGLTGRPFELVEKSGAPRGEKFFLFVNPPVVNAQLGIRRSYLAEARRVALEFLRHNLQMILFAQSRLAVEILTTYLKDAFHGPPGAADVIRGYRGGYLPNRRREIERGLREGQVRAVVSTNALELGIDIGALDVSVMAGYPGTIAATWQRAGRAGRRTTRSAAVLVASSAPIDQFIVRNPSYFFDASPEHALINPDNLHILLDHVKCAAFELPFSDRRAVRPRAADEVDLQEVLVGAGGGGVRPPGRRPVELDERVVSGRRRQPAVGVVRQLRRRRLHQRRAGDWRDRLHERAVDAAREGDLHPRGAAVPGRAARFRRPQGLPARGGLRLLHGRDHLHEGHDPGHVRVGSGRVGQQASADGPGGSQQDEDPDPGRPTARSDGHAAGVCKCAAIARRGPRRVPRGRLQEDQVLHERERRVRRARSARAADAHLVVLADDSGRGDGVAAVRRRRSPRRRRRAGVRDEERRAAAADVRRPRHRAVGGRRHRSSGRRGPAGSAACRRRWRPIRTCSSTTIIPAASASAGRCSRCTRCCSSGRAT